MCPRPIVTGLVLSSIVFATASAQAQVVVDVSKITCDQYVHAKITTPNLIAAWLIPACGDIDSSTPSSAPEPGANIPLDHCTFLQWMCRWGTRRHESGSASFGITPHADRHARGTNLGLAGATLLLDSSGHRCGWVVLCLLRLFSSAQYRPLHEI